jgi:uncharacterized repeat protein (TIGR01451 family)
MRKFFTIATLIILSAFTASAQRVLNEYGEVISNGSPLTVAPNPTIINPVGELPSVTGSMGTAWLPMGLGHFGEVYQTTIVDGVLYALQNGKDFSGTLVCAISKWDGTQWVQIGTFDWTSRGVLFTGYKGDLYVEVTTNSQYLGMSRWNGTKWSVIKTNDNLSPLSLMVGAEYQGDLYVGGWTYQTTGGNNISRWDGKKWNLLGDGIDNRDGLAGAGPDNTQVVTMAEYRGKLYVGGRFSHAGGVRSPYLAAWNGTGWEPMPVTPVTSVEDLCVLDDKLYMYCATRTSSAPGNVAVWDGTQLQYLPMHPFDAIFGMTAYEGSLYICGRSANGTGIARWDGSTWETFDGFVALPGSTLGAYVGALIEHDGSLIAGGNFKTFGNTILNNIARMCKEGDCGAIAGNVFQDRNANCTRDDGDSTLPRRIVMIEPGPIYVTTNPSGEYLQHVPPGDYTLSLLPPLHWDQTCPTTPATHAAAITSGNEHVEDIDFAMEPQANVKDVRVSMTAGRPRPGGKLEYAITYENIGTVPVDGSVLFTYDPRLAVAGSTPPADRTTAGSLGWDVTGLLVDESRTIHVTLDVPTTMQAGEVLCAYVTIELNRDPDYSFHDDNRDSICVTVVNSCDPNAIAVRPEGFEGTGEIQRTDTMLTYTIWFQNTGTGSAHRVIVIDTLPSQLDPRTLRLGAASHQYSYTLTGTGVLTWVFDNILLPDDKSNEPASHGMVTYYIRQRPDLPIGTTIANRAHIYFDYNASVTTNTVISVIAGELGVKRDDDASEKIALTPNPSTGGLRIDARMRRGGEIAVLDMLGRRMLSIPVESETTQAIDLSGLPSGTYLLALPAPGGVVMRQVVVVR